MKVIIPKTITDAVLKSSTLAEADAAAWSNVTTYAADALVMYEHRVYKSLKADNVGKVPGAATSAEWWSDQGATNRWAMFDDRIGTVSTTPSGTSTMTVELDFGQCSGFALFGLDATTLYAEVKNSEGTVIWSETTNLTVDPLIVNWLDYFTEPIVARTEYVKTALPIYGLSTLKVTVSKPSGTVGIGSLVVGRDRFVGLTKWGAEAGITDFSRKSTDAFGYTYLKQGDYAKETKLDLHVKTSQAAKVFSSLAAIRGKITVFIGDNRDNGFQMLTIFGFCSDFRVTPGLGMSSATVEIQGLI